MATISLSASFNAGLVSRYRSSPSSPSVPVTLRRRSPLIRAAPPTSTKHRPTEKSMIRSDPVDVSRRKHNATDQLSSALRFLKEEAGLEEAKHFLKQLEGDNLDCQAIAFLIQAYGRLGLYDDLSRFAKSVGHLLDEATYNLLLVEFASAGLVGKMEEHARRLLSARLPLKPKTKTAMLEAYANLGCLQKMDDAFFANRNRSTFVPGDRLVRKMAMVYLQNYRFSRLEDLGRQVSLRAGRRTPLACCLELLSHACILSRKGMDAVAREVKAAGVWADDASFANAVALAYLKMKDPKSLSWWLASQFRILPHGGGDGVRPDMVTFGVAMDGYSSGLLGDGGVLQQWVKRGFLNEAAATRTDPLVIAAFGKGAFHRACEERYMTLHLNSREKELSSCSYQELLRLVSVHLGV
ncbi:pentatricopeptide repeat-containing protein At4g14190, chloroplastic [Nymphaea colorata]|uniref:Pentacotripeptide-repeat region of PRORP domain-containing protein n=1 Tax=Nymphaea colorata TaxID=210225 RepID=A0A5K1E0L8_9MAGN|nr:pentatricopeptide repeat-containing protein At4g14190, chloroplastic [Nymphaea colorata]